MLFSSMTFLSIFLPLLAGTYWLVKKEWRNIVLLIFSIIFYAWGEPKLLCVMLLTILVTYLGGRLIEKSNHKKFALIITTGLILSFLIYFKYFNFLITNINTLFQSHLLNLDIIMPIGISFYTFQALSYIIDVYRGECPVQKSLTKLALYICLFPQLIAGPIIRYNDIKDQIENRENTISDVAEGIKRFIFGLSKKVLLANTLGTISDKIFAQNPSDFTSPIAWLGIICFGMQLFFDFSGYSDMAIGLCRVFGFRILENFNYPFISKSVTEFWTRWNISVANWFRLYVYYPLGGNKKGLKRQYLNLLIVFFLVGLWHGANWTFVIWGVYFGLLTIFEKVTNLYREYTNKYINYLKRIYFLFVLSFAIAIFRSENMTYAMSYISAMFRNFANSNLYPLEYYIPGYWEIIVILVSILCCTPIFKNKKFNSAYILMLLILCIMNISASTYNPFIYFRF